MYIAADNRDQILINDYPVKIVNNFTYFGILIKAVYGASFDVKARIGKSNGDFAMLKTI